MALFELTQQLLVHVALVQLPLLLQIVLLYPPPLGRYQRYVVLAVGTRLSIVTTEGLHEKARQVIHQDTEPFRVAVLVDRIVMAQ